MTPSHFNQHFESTTQLWNGSDSKERFKQNLSNAESGLRLRQLGWCDDPVLTYTFNDEGFRDEEFDQQPAGLALGCSHTLGTGLHAHQSWPSQLQTLLGQKVWNLGVGGAAADTCVRLLDYWINNLNVQFVVCAVPDKVRYEIFVNNNWSTILPSEQFQQNMFWLEAYHKRYLSYDQNSDQNRRKNLLAMQQICQNKNVPFYYHLLQGFNDAGLARDLMHCGPQPHYELAEKFYHTLKGNNYEPATSSH